MKTNFGVCCESVETMAQMIDIMQPGWTKEHIISWLKQPFQEYRPMVIEGQIHDTGWPIDGHKVMLSSWDYDNHESWHLDYWKNKDDRAVMETMYITETAAGMCLHDTLKEFAEHWEEWEPEGVFCIPTDKVKIIRILQKEQKVQKVDPDKMDPKNCFERLAVYERMHEKVIKRIEEIKSTSYYPHNFTGQMVEDLEWVLSQIN